jgi:hypothetical protein
MLLFEYALLVFYTFLDVDWVFLRFDNALGIESDGLARWQSWGHQL